MTPQGSFRLESCWLFPKGPGCWILMLINIRSYDWHDKALVGKSPCRLFRSFICTVWRWSRHKGDRLLKCGAGTDPRTDNAVSAGISARATTCPSLKGKPFTYSRCTLIMFQTLEAQKVNKNILIFWFNIKCELAFSLHYAPRLTLVCFFEFLISC